MQKTASDMRIMESSDVCSSDLHAAAAKSPRPTIGITLDSEPAGGWSNYPWYAVRENYCAAVVAAGGLPVLLPHEPEHAEAYLDRIDALLVTGGAFDLDPALFGADTRHETVRTKDRRTAFEASIARGALDRDLRSDEHTSEPQSLMRHS